MTRTQRRVRISWLLGITHAIQRGDDDAAYALTVGYIHRLKELGLL